ncbi:MAG: leucine-rich repeat domain-containing protein [Pseudobacteriovorax sp.]|nr:leucine-rich repeat domain-containing protein [Pseudobacteriovorax sp.]
MKYISLVLLGLLVTNCNLLEKGDSKKTSHHHVPEDKDSDDTDVGTPDKKKELRNTEGLDQETSETDSDLGETEEESAEGENLGETDVDESEDDDTDVPEITFDDHLKVILQERASDELFVAKEGETLKFKFDQVGDSLTLDCNGITGRCPKDDRIRLNRDLGTLELTFGGTDSGIINISIGHDSLDEKRLMVIRVDEAINKAPEIISDIGETVFIDESDSYHLEVQVKDDDSRSVYTNLICKQGSQQFQNSLSAGSVAINHEGRTGEYLCKVIADDTIDKAERLFSIIFETPTFKPVLAEISAQSFLLTEAGQIQFMLQNADGLLDRSQLSFSVTCSNPALENQLDPATGILSWPAQSFSASETIDCQVTAKVGDESSAPLDFSVELIDSGFQKQAFLRYCSDLSYGESMASLSLAISSENNCEALSTKIEGLKGVDLSFTDNARLDDKVLATLAHLEFLDISAIALDSLDALEGFRSLKTLIYRNGRLNRIQELNLPSLTTLNLSSLKVADQPLSDLSFLKGLRDLEYLYLADNEISDLSAIAGIQTLKVLDLNRNLLADLKDLPSSPFVTRLELSGNKIEDEQLSFISEKMDGNSSFQNDYMTYIDLSHNQLVTGKGFKNFGKVVMLDLSFNQIEIIDHVIDTRAFKRLKYMNLYAPEIEIEPTQVYLQNLSGINLWSDKAPQDSICPIIDRPLALSCFWQN